MIATEADLFAELDALARECPELESDPVLAEYAELAANSRRHATARPGPKGDGR